MRAPVAITSWSYTSSVPAPNVTVWASVSMAVTVSTTSSTFLSSRLRSGRTSFSACSPPMAMYM